VLEGLYTLLVNESTLPTESRRAAFNAWEDRVRQRVTDDVRRNLTITKRSRVSGSPC